MVKDAFKVGDKVWVIYPPYRKKPEDTIGIRRGVVHSVADKYVVIWIVALNNPKQGWRECFMFHDIVIGQVTIIPRRAKRGLPQKQIAG